MTAMGGKRTLVDGGAPREDGRYDHERQDNWNEDCDQHEADISSRVPTLAAR
jgi:hypothetical protein